MDLKALKDILPIIIPWIVVFVVGATIILKIILPLVDKFRAVRYKRQKEKQEREFESDYAMYKKLKERKK